MRVSRWSAPAATSAAARELLPLVLLAGLLAVGMIALPEIKPALAAIPALAAVFSRRAWYPLAVGGLTVVVSYLLTADDNQPLAAAEATTRAIAIAAVSVIGSAGAVVRDRQERVLTQTRMVADAAQRVLARPIPDRIGPVQVAVHYTAADA